MLLWPDEQVLWDTGVIKIVPPNSDEIPEDDRAAIKRGFSGHLQFGTGSVLAAAVDRPDGTTLIVCNSELERSTLRHEMIHCAQVYASSDVLEACMAEAASLGRNIIVEINRSSQSLPADSDAHRDLEKMRKAWKGKMSPLPSSPALMIFDTLRSYYPTPLTKAVAAEIGFMDEEEIYSLMTAAVLEEIGMSVDASSQLGREIVAYGFQSRRASSIEALFADAAAAAVMRREESNAFTNIGI